MNLIKTFKNQIIRIFIMGVIVILLIFLTLGCGSQRQVLTTKEIEQNEAVTEKETASYVQQGTIKIRSEGASKIEAGDIAKAKELALSNALRKAVESQLDALLELSIEEARTVKAKFIANPKRYIATLKLVRESVNSNIALTVLDIEVLIGRIVYELIEQGFWMNLKYKPLLTVVISETQNDTQVANPFMAPELTKLFLGYGFNVREQKLSHQGVQSILQPALQEKGFKIAKQQFNSDVVIIGQANSEILQEKFGKFTSCRINAVITAINNNSSEVLASDTFSHAGLGLTETDAMRVASAKIAPKAAESIAKSVLQKWAPAVYSGKVTPHVDQTASKPPQITIHAPDDKSIFSLESILFRGTIVADKAISNVKILHNGVELAITKELHIVKVPPQKDEDAIQISRSISLAPGLNLINVTAYDADNNKALKEITVFRNTSEANQLIEIHSPTDSEITAERFVHLHGKIKDIPSAVQIEVNGEPLPVKKDLHLVENSLQEGIDPTAHAVWLNYQIPLTQAKNIIGITASLPTAGKVEKYLTVFFDSASMQKEDVSEPQIVIYSPPDNTKTSAQVIRLQGEIITKETISKITIEKNGTLEADTENPEFVEYDAATSLSQGLRLPMAYEINREVKLQVGENKIQLTAHYGQNKKVEKQLAITLQDAAPNFPQIVIQSPKDSATVTTNQLHLKGYVANAAVSEITFLVNGVELATHVRLARGEYTKTDRSTYQIDKQIPLAARKNIIKIVASTDAGELTAERTIMATLFDEPSPTDEGVTLHSATDTNKYAVIIGIGKYKDTSIQTLKYAEKDAEEIYKFLINPAHGNFPQNNVKMLINEEATLKNIKSAIGTWLPQNAKPDDMVILFYSGHGGVEPDISGEEPDGNNKYIIPYDAQVDDLFATALLNSHISTMLDRVSSNRMIFFIDCCYSGGVTNNISGIKTISKSPLTAGINVYGQLSGIGRVVIAASQANEVSFETPEYEHGIFTYYLLKGLRSEADSNHDSVVTLFELFPYLSVKIPNSVPAECVAQNPVFMGTLVGDVVLAKVSN
jgi:hypothetical protein